MAKVVVNDIPAGADRAAFDAAIKGASERVDLSAAKLVGEAAAQVDGMAQVLSGALSASIYRPTPAEAMDLAVGTYFVTTDPETGKKALFERTVEAPGYAYFGPWIEKADVGLEDYPTSPEALPISTAQQEALDERIPYFASAAPDDSDRLVAFMAELAAKGGGEVRLAPLVRISKKIKVPDGVNLRGFGTTRNTSAGSIVKCIGSDAQLAFGGRYTTKSDPSFGGESGNFTVDGGDLVANPFYIGRSLKRVFSAIQVLNATGDCIVIEEAQNCVFNSVNSDGGDRSLVIDRGAGGLLFNQCNWNDAATVGIRGQETWGTGQSTGVYANPQQITFVKCITERADTGRQIDLQGCQDWLFVHCDIASSVSGLSSPVDLMKFDACARIEFSKGNFVGTPNYSTACRLLNASSVTFSGAPRFNGFQNLFAATASDRINISNYGVSGLTGNEDADATTTNATRRLFKRALDVQVGAGQYALIARTTGDVGFRSRINADGSISFADGSTFTADASFFRGGAGVISTAGVFQGQQGVGTGPRSAEPAVRRSGYAVCADGANWDPLALGTGKSYWVWWTGSAWRGMHETADGTNLA